MLFLSIFESLIFDVSCWALVDDHGKLNRMKLYIKIILLYMICVFLDMGYGAKGERSMLLLTFC